MNFFTENGRWSGWIASKLAPTIGASFSGGRSELAREKHLLRVSAHLEKNPALSGNFIASKLAPTRTATAGFTLIELVIVIVLLGIIGTMGAGFISQAFKGFSDTDIRMEIYEEGKAALVRMEREIHIALPNAVDPITGDSIRFGVIDENKMADVFGQYTEEHPSGGNTITDRAPLVAGTGLPEKTLVSIYNTGWQVFANGSRLYRVTSDGINPMVLTGGAGGVIGPASPYRRYYAVRDQAIRFYFSSGTLYRATASVSAGVGVGVGGFASDRILAKNVQPAKDSSGTNLDYFNYTPGTSTRNGLVAIHFAISRHGETVNFHKEVQIRNVP